jgi:predicted flavoprotein YhiN
MNKVRCFFAIVALVATLGGFSLQGMGASSLANAAASQHASTISSPMALKIYGPCPTGGTFDC